MWLVVLSVSCIVASCVAGPIASPGVTDAQKQRLPIIDMHLHAYPAEFIGKQPANPVTGQPSTAATDEALRNESLAGLERYNIVRAVTGGPLETVGQWKAAAPERVMASLVFPFPGGWPDLASLRAAYKTGKLEGMGELTLQYWGLTLSSPEMEPYLALAEELSIPVAVHTGYGPPGIAYHACCPRFRASLGNPLLIEEALVRHPKLRIYIMHAGFPFLENTIALMHSFPQVYADLAGIDWIMSREDFHDYLRRLLRHSDDCDLAKRLMFGSDQVVWPEAIGMAIARIESADFVTPEQKRDLFCRNAARFLRLEPAICEQRPSQKR
jgi:predicted TIM-barrel fold metal-dependent hydrolase